MPRRKKAPAVMHRNAIPPLLLFTALLTACAPEEKTMQLPLVSSAEDETQANPSDRDFTVKKIYTYSYETLELLDKSAFLSGSGENEVHILSAAGENEGKLLEYRQVDYRYGFYDVAGDYVKTWENWDNAHGQETTGDLYIEQLLPSPDGKRLLINIRSDYRDAGLALLYTLGEREPLILYENSDEYPGGFRGSFSPGGRWVTYDAAGASTNSTGLVPIYDCSRIPARSASGTENPDSDNPPGRDDYWPIGASALLAPDQVLYTPELLANDKIRGDLSNTGLCDSGSQPGLISLITEKDSDTLFIRKDGLLPEKAIVPSLSLTEEKARPMDAIFYTEQTLPGYQDFPYPVYQYSADGGTVYYMSNPLMLWTIDMAEMPQMPQVLDLPNYVWDFLALPSGDILAALVKETANDYLSVPEANTGQYIQKSGTPSALQEYWGILSADLYLYPKGSGEGQLLYKNLQNLISMEYDQDTGRILLETYENRDMSKRRCILLEL